MPEIQGSLINFKVRVNGTNDAFRTMICTEDTTFNIDNETTERRTNCGIKQGIADPTFNATGNAVFDYGPDATEVSYDEVKEWQKAKTKLDFQYLNAADVAAGITEGEAISISGSGRFTSSSFNASAEADGVGSFSWTFTGSGTLDEYDDES
jgi:hypothetical protein